MVHTQDLVRYAAIGAGGFVLLGYILLKWSPWKSGGNGVNRRVRKKFKTPAWAISRQKELEFPDISKEKLVDLNRRRPPDVWNTVLTFPNLDKANPDAQFNKLTYYLQQAKVSLLLSVYLCSSFDISDVIAEQYKKGLLVLIVTDHDTWTAHNNRGLKALKKKGIEVRFNTNGYLMHNKFAIIDEEAVMTGSLNWTNQGITSNYENVLITTNPRHTRKYVQEFNKLWNECKELNI